MEGIPPKIESEDVPALVALVREKYPDASDRVIGATARVLQVLEQTTPGLIIGEEEVQRAFEQANAAHADVASNTAHVIDSNGMVLGKQGSVDTELERNA